MIKTVGSANRQTNGRFGPKNCANPNGANQFTSILPLIEALKKAGVERGEDFWDMVAARCWSNETVLVAVLKKVIPDKMEHSGEIKFTEQEKLERINRIRGLIPNF